MRNFEKAEMKQNVEKNNLHSILKIIWQYNSNSTRERSNAHRAFPIKHGNILRTEKAKKRADGPFPRD